jgi:tRNA(His) 5'-end guanylyltransferase
MLFRRDDQSFGRKLRKLNSLLAGEASAKFTSLLGEVTAFDCRISQLPTRDLVLDYFRWRNEDAARNALNAHCYWMLQKGGFDGAAATAEVEGKSVSANNELLFGRGANSNELPPWQRRGCGVVWERYEKTGKNPKTGEITTTQRRRLKTLLELPVGDQYETFVSALVDQAG